MAINHVTISGNLTRNPEMRMTQTGLSVLSFGVAVNDRVKDASGEWTDRPNYIDCVVFGKRGEALEHKLYKGLLVAIEGKLRYSSWEKDGQRRSKLDVVVNEMVFTPAKNSPSESPKTAYNTGYDRIRESDFQPASPYDENIPF